MFANKFHLNVTLCNNNVRRRCFGDWSMQAEASDSSCHNTVGFCRLFCFSSVHCHNKTNWYYNKKKTFTLFIHVSHLTDLACRRLPTSGNCLVRLYLILWPWLLFMDEDFDPCHFLAPRLCLELINQSVLSPLEVSPPQIAPCCLTIMLGSWFPQYKYTGAPFCTNIILLLNDESDNWIWNLWPFKSSAVKSFSAPSPFAHVAYW